MDAYEKRLKMLDLRLKYAWDYFALHARQRTTMFSFFLISVGILANAIIIAWESNLGPYGLGSLLELGALFSLGFLFLDIRNGQLVKMAENVLEKLEREYIFVNLGNLEDPKLSDSLREAIPLALLHREKQEKKYYEKLEPEESFCQMIDNNKDRSYLRIRPGWLGTIIKHKWVIRSIETGLCAVFFVVGVLVFLGCIPSSNPGSPEVQTVKIVQEEGLLQRLDRIDAQLDKLSESAAPSTNDTQ